MFRRSAWVVLDREERIDFKLSTFVKEELQTGANIGQLCNVFLESSPPVGKTTLCTIEGFLEINRAAY